MEDDEIGDAQVARNVAATLPEAELSCTPAIATCSPTTAWRPTTSRARALVLERTRAFLDVVG